MDEPLTTPQQPLTRQRASDAVSHLGWRYVLGVLCAHVPVASLAQAARTAAHVTGVAGADADGHLWLDVRHDRLVLHLQSPGIAAVTPRDVELAQPHPPRHLGAA
jgi:4a-hydroxytetrahydrobiopterin dehydratase